MESRAFANRIRSLFSIDGYLLPELTPAQQTSFVRDPVGFFLQASDAHSRAIMREVEARQTTPNASDAKVGKTHRGKKLLSKSSVQRELLLPIAGGKPGAAAEEEISPALRKSGRRTA